VAATLLAFDDTDSPDGMCTTFLATLMLKELRSYDLIGLPRLVRLNPNIPWKTRGNAAICLPLGVGVGASTVCGEVDGAAVRTFGHGTPASPRVVLDAAAGVLERVAEFDCDKTNPGIVCTNRRPPPGLYWKAVRGVIELKDVEAQLAECGAEWKKYKNGRGVIGAASAASWRPRDRTWEVIAYRDASKVGTPRSIDPESVVEMDQRTAHTFHNYDFEAGHVAIAPASPCPVLFGIRGDSPDELLEARSMIRGETPSSWLLFLTNQGTDDHVVTCRVRDITPGMSVRVSAMVSRQAVTIEGGHVIIGVSDGDEVDAVFYEPSGSLRNAARKLVAGDRVVVYGSVREEPRGINVEKLQVVGLQELRVKLGNPVCPTCSKRMGSMGSGQGYRCKVCGARMPTSAVETAAAPREIAPGWYEPPVASRRHLYKPERRMTRGNINNLL